MAKNNKQNTVELDQPIKRGDQEIKTVSLRCPTAGELRGVSLVELMNMNTDALTKVIPRLSNPTLTDEEIKQMSPADLVQIATEVVGFLVPKRLQENAAE